MKSNHLVVVLCMFICLITNGMEIALALSKKSYKVEFLDKTLESIKQHKHSDPEKYFADKQHLANGLVALASLRNCLFRFKKNYNLCKISEWAVFYNKKYINGFAETLISSDTQLIDTVKTPLGFLKKHTPIYGDSEFIILLTTPAERAFSYKLRKVHSFLATPEQVERFLCRHLNSPEESIKIMANNYLYLFANQMLVREIGLQALPLYNFFNTADMESYFSDFNLKALFRKEFIALSLAIKAFQDAGEAAPSIIEKVEPLCMSGMWEEFLQEDKTLNEYYKNIIKETQDELYNYDKKNYKKLIMRYLSFVPAYQKAFALSRVCLPGVTKEKPIEEFLVPKQVKNKQSKKKHVRAAAQEKKKIDETSSDLKNDSQVVVTENNVSIISLDFNATHDQNGQEQTSDTLEKIADGIDDRDILYDNRVLEQNMNKKDFCHGFTLMVVPYIIKHGAHSLWANKKTRHNDDLATMYGEIEYTNNGTITKRELVRFEICKGSDSAIYHIGMRKNNSEDMSNATYDVQFPPLGTTVTVCKKSSSDDFGSRVLIETDYMIQLWDGGLKATITLYK